MMDWRSSYRKLSSALPSGEMAPAGGEADVLGWKLGVATLGMAALFLWLGIRIEPYGVPDEPDALRTDVAGRIVGWMITCLVFVLRWWCF